MKNKVQAFLIAAALVLSCAPAFAQYDVDFGTSNDTGNSGSFDLGNWFFTNGYAPDAAAGENFAKTGYIGHGAADADPFKFSKGQFTFEVVQRISGNADLQKFGFYNGVGAGKTLTQLLGLGQTTKSSYIDNAFGLYLNTPISWQNVITENWFTDRAENVPNQNGSSPLNAGGDPQGLVYNLGSNQWLVAWEDIDYSNTGDGSPGNGSDRDFNDAYLKVTHNPTVTPEPASMALFGLGAAAMGASRMRRKNKKK